MFKYNLSDIKIKTSSGYQNFKGIQKTKKIRNMIKIYTDKNIIIDVTENHKLKRINGEFEAAHNLRINDELESNSGTQIITKIENYIDDCFVYDLIEVENGNEYYTNDLVSHNCSFLGSSLTLLSVDSLSKLSKTNPLVEDYIVPGAKLYREFNPEAKYLITVDTSKTVEKQNSENDYISLNVLELTETSIEQALTFRSNDIHYTDMSEIIYQIGEAFDYPWVVVENNEGAGQSIVDNLHSEYEYPNIYADPKHNGEILGIRTTTSRRPLALSSLKKLVELDIFNIYDADTIDEFFTFVKIGKKYQASSGATDDCIMSLSLVGTFLSDENNDLEITLKDYLKSEVTIERNNDDDLDFFSGTRTQEDIDTYYLLEGKDY